MRRVKRSTRKSPVVKAAELAIAAPQVVAVRTARMLAAGSRPGAADRAELSRMSTEKVQAFWESMFAMGTQLVRRCDGGGCGRRRRCAPSARSRTR